MALTVLNPRGRDPEQRFDDGPGQPGDPGHAPVNFHAYAACTGGAFVVDTARAIAAGAAVLVLIRHRLRHTLKVVEAVRQAGLPCYVSWKETGTQQVAAQLGDASRLARFREIVSRADGVITPSDELIPLYDWALDGSRPIHFVPTPYPLEHHAWSFSQSLTGRDGIFVGTRSFRHLYRLHLTALALAAALARRIGCRVTVIDTEGRRARRVLGGLGVPDGLLHIAEPRPYADYLRLMAQHRLVLQCDMGSVPGQVAGDALLCRMPCVGGNGVIDRLGFPHLCGGARGNEMLGQLAGELLTDDRRWQESVDKSQQLARERLAFGVVAQRLREIAAG